MRFLNRDDAFREASAFSRRDFVRLCAAIAACPPDHRAVRWQAATAGLAPSGIAEISPGKLTDVNTTSLRAGVELGCQALGHLFNPNDPQGAPYFWMNLRPVTFMAFSDLFSDAQVPGKSLLGLLTAQKLVGVSVDPSVVERYARVAFFSYGGPVALPLNRHAVGGRLVNFGPVNVAHGFHALYALATYSRSDRAQALFEKSIGAVSDLWNQKTGWDRHQIEGVLGLKYRDVQPDAPFIAGLAMAIGPLAKYYQATGSRTALDLATTLKEHALAEYFPASGEYDPARLGAHVQNVVYVMASLAWLATATRDESLMTRVKAFYDNGLKKLRNSIGWAPEYVGSPAHVAGPRGTNADRGEAGNTALIVETALLLGAWGHPEAFADAEFILRSHVLPTQVRDVSFIVPPGSRPGGHDPSDVAGRVRGTWGFPAPYGHLPVGDNTIGVGTDIVGPVVYALAEAHSRIVGRVDDHLAVQLFFDYKNNEVEVMSSYTTDALIVKVRTAERVMVRIPPWVDARRVELMGIPRESVAFVGDYVRLSHGAAADGHFAVRFPLTSRHVDLSFGGRTIRARARGDQIVAMDSRSMECRFFDPYSP
ncbi:MAG TPA: hypothetical protein VM032_02055 [Vicinamibacterales bacterium]|nr:hypothetical protein [Vicinamibacterales bacterium]